MDLAALINRLDFFSYLSRTYGSGNVLVDSAFTLTVLIALQISFLILQRLSAPNEEANRAEERCLKEAWDLLNEISCDAHELRNALVKDFEKYRGELGFIRHQAKELRSQQRARQFIPNDLTWSPVEDGEYGQSVNF